MAWLRITARCYLRRGGPVGAAGGKRGHLLHSLCAEGVQRGRIATQAIAGARRKVGKRLQRLARGPEESAWQPTPRALRPIGPHNGAGMQSRAFGFGVPAGREAPWVPFKPLACWLRHRGTPWAPGTQLGLLASTMTHPSGGSENPPRRRCHPQVNRARAQLRASLGAPSARRPPGPGAAASPRPPWLAREGGKRCKGASRLQARPKRVRAMCRSRIEARSKDAPARVRCPHVAAAVRWHSAGATWHGHS